jgi:site-specific recombinase XerD
MSSESLPTTRLPSAGTGNTSHRSHKDRSGRFHFSLNANVSDRSQWLHRCRHWLLGGRVLGRHQPAFLLGSLIWLDAVTESVDLQAAWRSLAKIYRDGETVCLDWSDSNGAQNRRLLSSVTVLSWAAQHTPPPELPLVADQLLRDFSSSCSPMTPECDVPSSLEQLLEWTQAGLLIQLSGDLFAHVSRTDPLTAVPRSCLARRRRQLALVVSPDEGLLAEQSTPAMLLMDALYANESGGSADLVKAIQTACRANADEGSAYRQRQRMLGDLYALVPAAIGGGFWPSLLLLWPINLVRWGTRRTRPLSPHTIDPYIQLSLSRLYKQLRHLVLEALSPPEFVALYETIMADPTVEPSQRGKLAAALTAFHEFLQTILDVPPLPNRLDADTHVLAPRANVVWSHEIDWLFDQWFELPEVDRLAQQLRAVMALLVAACVRIQDAWHIHIAGVRPMDENLVIAIDPLPSAGVGKSRSARKEVDIQSPRCRQIVIDWLERLKSEGAVPRDLLFGDPSERRCAWRRGATEYLLNRWLKAVTGDPDVGTHTLRHTFATLAREGFNENDQRQLDGLSASAGHAATRTTLTSYVHLFEAALRDQLDQAIAQIHLTESRLCQLTELRPGTVRKRWQRTKGDPRLVTWATMAQCASLVDFPDVTDGFEFQAPSCPDVSQPQTWSFQSVLDCLTDLSRDYSLYQTQLRRGVSAEQLSRVDALIAQWRPTTASDLGQSDLSWRDGFSRVQQPKWAPVLALLRKASVTETSQVAASWRSCFRRQHLSLVDLNAALPVLECLAASGIRSEQLVVSHQLEPSDRTLSEALQLLRSIFSAPPSVRREQPRRGRPSMHLSVRSQQLAGRPPSNAANSLLGLDALMLSAWIFAALAGKPA